MKVVHRPDVDYLSIDFSDEPEVRSYLQDGIIVREGKNGKVVGIDILNSNVLFNKGHKLTLREACALLNISESTMRRWVRERKIPYSKPNGKDFVFEKSDILKLVS